MILSRRRSVLLAVLVAMLFAAAVRAQGPTILGDRKDVKFETIHHPRNQTIHGYDSFWFQVTNLSKTVPHTITVTVPRYSSMGQLRSIRRTVELKPGATEQLILWYPAMRMQGWDIEIRLDGRVMPPGAFGQGYTTDRGMHRYTTKQFYLLASPNSNSQIRYAQNLSKANFAKVDDELNYRQVDFSPLLRNQVHWHTGSPLGTQNRQGHEMMSRHWLSYSKYDGVIVSAKEWNGYSADVREGMLRYVECGGSLLIQGPWTPPAHWKRFEQKVGGAKAYHVGFGECIVAPESDPNKWQPNEFRYLAESWAMSAAPFHVPRTAGEAHTLFKVVDDVEVPIRGLFGLMVGFVILIGPVNLYILSRHKQRIWLLATVPAVSLVTCLTVLGYMLATEGFGSDSRVEAVTFLDENTGRAATIGWIGIYSTIMPSEGLRFTEDTELTPQWDVSQWRSASSRTLNWTKEQHLETGWVTPRLPTHFLARKSEERKEKLVVRKKADGQWAVSNSFGHPIKSILVADSKGKAFEAKDIAPGAEAVLAATEHTCTPAAKGKLRELFSTNWMVDNNALVKSPEVLLQPGYYVAVLDASPFLEDGMAHVDRRQRRAVVFGVMKEPMAEK